MADAPRRLLVAHQYLIAMPETKTATKEAPKLAPETEVLVHYNPSVREEGELTQSQLRIAADPISGKGLGVYMIRPGINKMTEAEWQVWDNHPSAEIRSLRSPAAGILRKVSDKTNLVEIYAEDPYLATEILRHTTNLQLLREWMDLWEQMDSGLREAMTDKSENMNAAKVSPTKFVFGRPVAA